ncbi:MAG TPA: hypothetical protein VHT75_17790 [Acidimicrobiales bacterium]|nr:hypothetical protein [Acidimicrobiales bacterium]
MIRTTGAARWPLSALVFVILAVPPAGCSRAASGTATAFASLDAAARAHLATLAKGLVAGDAAVASALSTGEVADQDGVNARARGEQSRAGAPIDFGFDVLSVASHPLDGGAADFVAYEKIRWHQSGSAANLIELYHREGLSAPWRAAYRIYLEDNVEPPVLRLDRKGHGHLLSPAEAATAAAQPANLAARYAAAVTVPPTSAGRSAGAFAPGQYTSGEREAAAEFEAVAADHGHGSRQWEAEPGGETVAVAGGVLSFATLQEVDTLHCNTVGATHFFVVQDATRVQFGGLLAPGHYADVVSRTSVMVGVVVAAATPPDVVGRSAQVVAIEGQPVVI